jgi:hypothetical protein
MLKYRLFVFFLCSFQIYFTSFFLNQNLNLYFLSFTLKFLKSHIFLFFLNLNLSCVCLSHLLTPWVFHLFLVCFNFLFFQIMIFYPSLFLNLFFFFHLSHSLIFKSQSLSFFYLSNIFFKSFMFQSHRQLTNTMTSN